ncbi:hypothetical protein KBZ00_17220 [Streptomyces sp. RK31]|uniref:hypothetical protein n=1 Tax=Streptomyces sp. RK31 TaxID=2824892 RepID=UPI001B385CF5|nr:hypothetical protein [Streptomyces sp. RK31]MBQ0972866.1 hypothetical protein [Streptomyces sp. RK31]
MSESWVDHRVLPSLRGSGVVSTEVVTKTVGGVRRVAGLRWELLPLTAAQSCPGHPLALEKRELAVLLSLCEVLFAPGWSPVGKPETPAGLLGERRGRGAADERLGLLRLVLAARPDGRVRLVGGAVASGFDRADATVARLLGCPLAEAAQVVDGLIRQRLLEVPGRGVPEARVKIVVPAVAAASGRGPRALRAVPDDDSVNANSDQLSHGQQRCCVHCAKLVDETDPADPGEGWVQERFFEILDGGQLEAADALRDQENAESPESGQENAVDLRKCKSFETSTDKLGGALLHADHAPVLAQGGYGAASSCFSGEAAQGSSALPGRAGEREDQPDTVVDEADACGGSGGPLRGEQHQEVVSQTGQGAVPPTSGQGVPSRWSLPRGLERVLAPARFEWARIGRSGGRARVNAAVRAELRRVSGVVGPERAEVVLSERLERRLIAQQGEPVRDPVGWFLGRGLPQRAECYAISCDDGVRMDTGLVCSSCELLIRDRKALRRQVARAITEAQSRLSPEEFRTELERRLSREVARQAAQASARRERAVVERAQREEAWARHREELAEAEAAWAARPCEVCGVPEAGGLCLVCSQARTARQALERAAEIAAAVAGPVHDLGEVAGRLVGCRSRLEEAANRAEQRAREQGLPEAAVAWEVRERAEALLREERERALEVLASSAEARAEAKRVRAIERARRRDEQQALPAAEAARQRCAEALLTQRLGHVRTAVQAPIQEPVGDWRKRLAMLAQRPLGGESGMPPQCTGESRKAVSAA